MGVPASAPFIGLTGNNFSHKINNCSCPFLSQADSGCPASVQSLSQSDSTAVALRSINLSRFATGAGRFSAQASPSTAAISRFFRSKQKTATRGLPPAAIIWLV
jgi:hypothetical protein